MLGNTEDTARKAHLIKKYRGDLEVKHPNLRKFTNKVLEKKVLMLNIQADIIAEGMNRCGSQHTLFKRKLAYK